ncbi:DUF4159 domain-containing protein [Sinomicrobium soli]|uniref:DUF4159 domain-containing protein n=1 Tax=Sinomicrobium sp. N-1-3-6 TaxID=2219864 RepID=UPI000DCF25DB|nr:DUF4159 domain-containing protein [Sinomicrobium sp. N-1-3-6]RAV30573.1 hypothetical protein DN748_03505 [Sinomicrobium sp. N-1-3-6]
MNKLAILLLLLSFSPAPAQEIAVLKYGGGGDWYANPTALPNLIRFSNRQLNTRISEKPATVEAGSMDIFQYPLLHMTGHGHVFFSDKEAENLRTYLLSGGFLHADDNYGLRPYLEKEMQKVFPDKTWTEIPPDHPVFNQKFHFPDGLPKIHEHDNKRPQAFGYFHEGRLVFLFTFESDLGDGWEDPQVHNDPEEVRQKALRMGANIVQYVFQN